MNEDIQLRLDVLRLAVQAGTKPEDLPSVAACLLKFTQESTQKPPDGICSTT